ncbi:MAG: hypothetical protein PXZ07_00410 [Candidatus Eremiobacteraeota bacterium]|uniref:Uncharacterized protein n=1 Tax=mine drainage metagenome TaxID=410659 RepID=E6Q648_9ZZZZ|nr:hypothetical protein [Candidatus Eremiobacteraeota bacterium]
MSNQATMSKPTPKTNGGTGDSAATKSGHEFYQKLEPKAGKEQTGNPPVSAAHHEAAGHHDAAAHHHRQAAFEQSQGEHELAEQHAHRAHDHGEQAHAYSASALAQLRGEPQRRS